MSAQTQTLNSRLRLQLTAACLISLALQACSGEYGPPVEPGLSGRDAGQFQEAGTIENPMSIVGKDAGGPRGAAADAFFLNDPAPPMCLADGGMSPPAPIAGSSECPADKNREGCVCPKPGMKAPCWPGKRQNRNHGICVDGTTTCRSNGEFGTNWGPCEGYVLPAKGALQGPSACRCFSSGKWALSNVVPCIDSEPGGPFMYSSHPDADGGIACDPVSVLPPPVPKGDWSETKLQVDCAGQYKLCYALRAGKASDPQPDDCALMRTCVDAWYAKAGVWQDLPNLPGWASADKACAKRFIEVGGYGEMTVFGKSSECDSIDDGHGKAQVFLRTEYCRSDCANTPDAPGCKSCSVSGSGSF